jgi:hypothetical protein
MDKKRTEILSFIGGLAFFLIVVGVLLGTNRRIRTEVEAQVQGFLNVSKGILQQVQFVIMKINKISGELKIDNENSNIAEGPALPAADDYDTLWQTVEMHNKAFIKTHFLQ